MKVCFFDFTTMVGGATKGSIYLLSRLKDKGIDTSIIDAYGSCEEHIKDIQDHCLPLKILYPNARRVTIGNVGSKLKRLLELTLQLPIFFKILINLILEIKRQKPSHILVNNEKSLFFVSIVKKLIEFKIVLYYRGEANALQMSKRFVNSINKNIDINYCHSRNAIINMNKFGVKKDIYYLPNCIPMSEVKNLKLLDARHSNKNFTILLNSGRVVKEKGYHTAIESVGILKQKGYHLNLILPGLLVDEEYYFYLNNLIQKLKLTESVSFMGWVDNITEVLSQSDCMVLPSYSEGFPRSIIESMYLKIPICATPVGGIPEAITHQDTGYIFNVDDSEGLAECLIELIDNPAISKYITQRAYLFASEFFDEELNTAIFLKNLE